jgi:hypothetical protein
MNFSTVRCRGDIVLGFTPELSARACVRPSGTSGLVSTTSGPLRCDGDGDGDGDGDDGEAQAGSPASCRAI